jgi:hypothetical protein
VIISRQYANAAAGDMDVECLDGTIVSAASFGVNSALSSQPGVDMTVWPPAPPSVDEFISYLPINVPANLSWETSKGDILFWAADGGGGILQISWLLPDSADSVP